MMEKLKCDNRAVLYLINILKIVLNLIFKEPVIHENYFKGFYFTNIFLFYRFCMSEYSGS